MTTEEIHDMIQCCDTNAINILPILERLNNKIAELEERIEKMNNQINPKPTPDWMKRI